MIPPIACNNRRTAADPALLLQVGAMQLFVNRYLTSQIATPNAAVGRRRRAKCKRLVSSFSSGLQSRPWPGVRGRLMTGQNVESPQVRRSVLSAQQLSAVVSFEAPCSAAPLVVSPANTGTIGICKTPSEANPFHFPSLRPLRDCGRGLFLLRARFARQLRNPAHV